LSVDSPSGKPELMLNRNPVCVNEDMTFMCNPSGNLGQPEASYFTYYSTLGILNSTNTLTQRFSSVKQSGQVSCSMGNEVGLGGKSDEVLLEILGMIHVIKLSLYIW
jgi:hypothetical protein